MAQPSVEITNCSTSTKGTSNLAPFGKAKVELVELVDILSVILWRYRIGSFTEANSRPTVGYVSLYGVRSYPWVAIGI